MFAVSLSKYHSVTFSLAGDQLKKNYNKMHPSRQWKCCYAYHILKFICVQRFIYLFLIAL